MKRTAAIVQARMGSTRLPGKVLMPLAGTTVLGCVLDRLGACEHLDAIAVATSDLPQDDEVAREAGRCGAVAVRGSASDVLQRFVQAATEIDADTIVRITADCPLIEGAVIDTMLGSFEDPPCDYLSNTLLRTFPRGLDAEIFTATALRTAAERSAQPHQREHVTPYIYEHPDAFTLRAFIDPSGSNRSQMRWTLDTQTDYDFLQAVYSRFNSARPQDVRFADMIALLERHPELGEINGSVAQKGLRG